jgi:methyl-accepting chemotaxis protein
MALVAGIQRHRLGLRFRVAGLAAIAALFASAIQLGVLLVLTPEASSGRLLPSVGIALAACAVATLSAWLLAARVTRPLLALRNAAAAIASGDLTARVSMDGTAEVADLAAPSTRPRPPRSRSARRPSRRPSTPTPSSR